MGEINSLKLKIESDSMLKPVLILQNAFIAMQSRVSKWSFNSMKFIFIQCKLDRGKHKVQILPKGKHANGNRNNTGLPKLTLQPPKKANSYWTQMGETVVKVYNIYSVERKYKTSFIGKSFICEDEMSSAKNSYLAVQFLKKNLLCSVLCNSGIQTCVITSW